MRAPAAMPLRQLCERVGHGSDRRHVLGGCGAPVRHSASQRGALRAPAVSCAAAPAGAAMMAGPCRRGRDEVTCECFGCEGLQADG